MSLIGKALAVRNQAPVPMGRPGGGVSLAYPYGSGGADDAALIRAFKRNGTARVNIGLLAYVVAAQQWKLFRSQPVDGRRRYTTSDQGSDQRTEVVNHQALRVLTQPALVKYGNGVTMPAWTRMSMMEIAGIWLESTGKAHLVVDRDPRSPIPLGLWPVPPTRIQPVAGQNWLKGWIYTSPDGRETVPLDPTDVLYLRTPDPDDLYGGCGALEPVLAEIDAVRYASEYNCNFFLNGAEPGGVIQVQDELDDDDFDRITSRWREAHRGVSRAHRIAVLEAGSTWVPNSRTQKDMDFVNLMTGGGDRVREAIGVGKTMSGVADDVNRANAQTAQEVFAAWNVEPRLERWRDLLNFQFLPLFGRDGEGLEFDFVYPTPINREADNAELVAKFNALKLGVDAGFEPEDVCLAVGLPAMDVAEKATQAPALPPGWVAVPGTSPAGAPAAPGGAPPDAAGEAEDQANDVDAGGNRLDREIRALLASARGREMAAFNMAGAR